MLTTSVMFSELNKLVMDYLVIGGYKNAAEFFSQEASVAPPVDLKSIESRMNIREALQRGDVQDAIMRVNDLDPEVCTLIFLPSTTCSGF
jgi:glucose-induced degradation protein 8